MNRLLRAIERVIEALGAIGVLSYCGAAAVSVADVVGRRIGTPVPGVVDLVQLFIMAGAWLSIPWAFLAGAHVGVDFLLDRMPRAWSRALHLLAALTAVVLMALILWQCWRTYQVQFLLGDKSQQLGIPISLYWLPLLLGAAASVLAILPVIIRLLTDRPVAQAKAH